MWLFYVDDEGMYCTLCRKFDTKKRQNQSKEWKDVLARHEASAMKP